VLLFVVSRKKIERLFRSYGERRVSGWVGSWVDVDVIATAAWVGIIGRLSIDSWDETEGSRG